MLTTILTKTRPWERKRIVKGNPVIERYTDTKWTEVKPEDIPKLGKIEAQIWLSLHVLLLEPACRAKYHFSTYTKDEVLKV